MYFFYMDDSRDERLCTFSAIGILTEAWYDALERIKAYRRSLREEYGIYVNKEFHASKFVGGRGRLGDRVVTKHERSQIFRDTMTTLTELPDVLILNACFPKKQDTVAFERVVNRINTTLEKTLHSNGLLICDRGKEDFYTALVRRMRQYNPIPSTYGIWGDTQTYTKNIPVVRTLEDPWFKQAEKSYFIQLADFVAYALLRKENPVPSKSEYGLHQAFDILKPVLFKGATKYDPLGVIRP